MLFDRIIEDSLGFIRRMLWSNKDQTIPKKPFQPTESIGGEFGFIYLLEGRDTPRAVRTWMYSPKRRQLNSAKMVVTSTPMDLHIYMDRLGPLPDVNTPRAQAERKSIEEQRQQGKSVNTHRLQILKASHFLNADGLYDCELVFWQEFDCCFLQENSVSQRVVEKKISVKVTDMLAFKCLNIAEPLKLKVEDWEEIVSEVVAKVKADYQAVV